MYPSLNVAGDKIGKNEMDGACSTDGEDRFLEGLMVKPVRKKPLGSPRHR
jgi:hypothetical protein